MVLRVFCSLFLTVCSVQAGFSIFDQPVENTELQQVFHNFKKEQVIPEAVSLHNVSLCSLVAYMANAAYYNQEQKVKLSPLFYMNPQSRKLFTLRHELAHAHQMKIDRFQKENEHETCVYWNSLIDDFVKDRPYYQETYPMTQATFVKSLKKAVEYNADKTACEQTECATCLTVAQRPAFLIPFYVDFFYELLDRGVMDRSKKGYFDERDFDPYVKERVQQDSYCKAHDGTVFKGITEYLASDYSFWPMKVACHKVLSCMDRMSGNLQDRLTVTKKEEDLSLPQLQAS